MDTRTSLKAGRGAVVATLAVSLSALASTAAVAQTSDPQPPPAPTQGTPPPGQPNNGEAGNQTQGTPTGAAAQGESATNGAPPPAPQIPAAPPAMAPQQRTPAGPGRISVTSSNSLTQIISRAQDMLRVAETRRLDAPSGARQSYSNAAYSLRKMLVSTGVGSASSNALGATDRAMGIRQASLSTLPVDSSQISDDIMVLRSAARQSGKSGKMIAGMSHEQIQKVASLYATGAKEFFTGQLRDALFDSPVTVASRSRSSQSDNRADDMNGAAAVRSDRPGVPFEVHLQSPGNQETNVSTAGSSSLPGEGGNPPLGVGVAAGPVGLTGGAAVPPNLQFASPGFYGGFYGPPAAIIGGYPGVGNFPVSGFYPSVGGGVIAPTVPGVPVVPVGP